MSLLRRLGAVLALVGTLAFLTAANQIGYNELVAILGFTPLKPANNLSDIGSPSAALGNLGAAPLVSPNLTTPKISGSLMTSIFAQVANNLSDLASAATARVNLGLGSAATLASSAVLQAANNLSELASAATARTNLGLGSAATASTGTAAGNVVALDGSAKLPAVDGSQLTNLPSSAGTITAPQGRLTLQSATPVMTADQTGKGTLYYDAFLGNSVPYYTGSANALDTIASNEVSLTLEASGTGLENSGDVFDVWWWHHAGAPVLCVATNGSGGGWSSDTGGSTTARGTGYSQLDKTSRAYPTNKNALTHCYNATTDYGSISANQATYLGTFYTSAAGQTTWQCNPAAAAGGGNGQLYLWNAHNRVPFNCSSLDNTSSWSYGTLTWRSADNSNSNRFSFVDGAQQSPLFAEYWVLVIGGATGADEAGIGINSTSANSASFSAPTYSLSPQTALARYTGYPLLGRNYVQALEYGGSSGTWYGAVWSQQTQGLSLHIAM